MGSYILIDRGGLRELALFAFVAVAISVWIPLPHCP